MKRSQGFTIIEVLIALGLLTSCIYVLSDLQMRSLFRVLKDREYLERIFLVKQQAYMTYLYPPTKPAKAIVVALEKPEIKISTEQVEIGKKSVLKKWEKKINLFKSTAFWMIGQRKQFIDILTIVPGYPEKEEKKA